MRNFKFCMCRYGILCQISGIIRTKYAETDSLQQLAKQLVQSTNGQMYLAVRTPVQWRKIMESADVSRKNGQNDPLYDMLGLFNDGMLGSGNDCGTYGEKSAAEAGVDQAWNRSEELAFQEKLCSRVPNGGEVIIDNGYNDFEHAIADLNLFPSVCLTVPPYPPVRPISKNHKYDKNPGPDSIFPLKIP